MWNSKKKIFIRRKINHLVSQMTFLNFFFFFCLLKKHFQSFVSHIYIFSSWLKKNEKLLFGGRNFFFAFTGGFFFSSWKKFLENLFCVFSSWRQMCLLCSWLQNCGKFSFTTMSFQNQFWQLWKKTKQKNLFYKKWNFLNFYVHVKISTFFRTEKYFFFLGKEMF